MPKKKSNKTQTTVVLFNHSECIGLHNSLIHHNFSIKICFQTYPSDKPLNITLGGVPVRVAIPPMFELKAAAKENVLASPTNLLSFSALLWVSLKCSKIVCYNQSVMMRIRQFSTSVCILTIGCESTDM